MERRHGIRALLRRNRIGTNRLRCPRISPPRLLKLLELAGNASLLYKAAMPEETRALLKIITPN